MPSQHDPGQAAERQRRLRCAARQALAEARPGRDLRAFAVEGVTCVVSWEPTPGSPRLHDVRLRLRSGGRSREHSLVAPDLRMLVAACEHHLRTFLLGLDAVVPPSGATPRLDRRDEETPDPVERLRARLASMRPGAVVSPVDVGV